MIAFPFVYRLPLAVAVCLTLIEGARLHAQEANLPEPIRGALARYAELDPLAVTWTQTTEATSLGQENIASDELDRILRDGSFVQQLAFRDGRIYMRRETKGDSSWPPRTDETAFDRNLFHTARNLFYTGNPGNGDAKDWPYLHKWLPKNDDPQASYFRDDYFRAAGIRLPARVKELVSSWHSQSELLALLAAGCRIEMAGPIRKRGEGREARGEKESSSSLVTLLAPRPSPLAPRPSSLRRYGFYLDPKRGYAVRRLEIRDESGRLLTRSDCTDFEQPSGRLIWMPRLCRVEEYTVAGARDEENGLHDVFTSPLYVTQIQVNAFDVKPWPDDRFQLKYTTPGIYGNDASFPEIRGKDGVFYRIPANSQRLEEVIAMRRTFNKRWMNVEKRSRPLRVLFLVLNGVGLASLAVYLMVRRRRKGTNR